MNVFALISGLPLNQKIQKPLFALVFAVFLIGPFSSNAQIGVYSGWNQMTFQADDQMNGDISLSTTGFTIGVDYWFRLRDYRVEFKPGLAYSLFEKEERPGLYEKSNTEWLHLVFQTRVYPLSFFDDCDCPTFSKQSTFFKDGFFFSFTPQLIRSTVSTNSAQIEGESLESTEISILLDLGAGLDIGLSDAITLTPEVRFRYAPSISGFNQITDPQTLEFESVDGRMSGFFAGIGLTWRLDQ